MGGTTSRGLQGVKAGEMAGVMIGANAGTRPGVRVGAREATGGHDPRRARRSATEVEANGEGLRLGLVGLWQASRELSPFRVCHTGSEVPVASPPLIVPPSPPHPSGRVHSCPAHTRSSHRMMGCGAVWGTVSSGREGGGVLLRTPGDGSLPGPVPRAAPPRKSPVLPPPTPFPTQYPHKH